MLNALNTLATQQAAHTEQALSALVRFMNYAAMHPVAWVQCVEVHRLLVTCHSTTTT